jgi:hypothetical protein
MQEVSHDLCRLQRQCRCDQVVRDLEQLPCQGRQPFHRQAAIPLAYRLGQRVADPGTDPDQGCLLDPDPRGDLIRSTEPDPVEPGTFSDDREARIRSRSSTSSSRLGNSKKSCRG